MVATAVATLLAGMWRGTEIANRGPLLISKMGKVACGKALALNLPSNVPLILT